MMQALDVQMRNLVVFSGQVLGSHGRAMRVGRVGAALGLGILEDHLGIHGLEGGG